MPFGGERGTLVRQYFFVNPTRTEAKVLMAKRFYFFGEISGMRHQVFQAPDFPCENQGLFICGCHRWCHLLGKASGTPTSKPEKKQAWGLLLEAKAQWQRNQHQPKNKGLCHCQNHCTENSSGKSNGNQEI